PDPEVRIRYTMDASIPDEAATLYDGALEIESNGSLRAVAFKDGHHPSEAASRSYLFDLNHDLPVLHLVTDPDNLFDDEMGIYTVGTNGTTLGFCADEEVANYNQDGWERPVNITFFEADGTQAFSVNAGIQIGGSCSRSQALKGLNIYLRNNRYGDKDIDYKLFPGKRHKKYKRLKLRNSGQDFKSMMFRDGAIQTIMRKIEDLEFQAYRPTVVYINGEYWGMQNLRELYGGEYFDYEKDVKEEDLQLIKNPSLQNVVKEGEDIHYRELYHFVETHDLSDPAHYQYVLDRIDLHSFMNYWASMIYISANDWPANNLLVWRENKAGAKWRWPVVDTDASTNHFGTDSGTGHFKNKLVRVLNPNVSGWPNDSRSTVLFRGLMDNEDFRNEYIQRTCSFMHLIFDAERVNTIVDSLTAIIDSEMSAHINRWNFDTPFLEDYTDWVGKVEKFKLFFAMRPELMRTHIQDNLDLNNTYTININFDQNSGGEVLINSNEMELPYQYSGIYFKDIPLQLKAVAKAGFLFSHWEETGQTDPLIHFTGQADAILTPIFIAACLPDNFQDQDEDGICDLEDNCPETANANQEDNDGDGIGDVCDDCDNAITGNLCDDGDPCTTDDRYDANCSCKGLLVDSDGDGVCDSEDLCEGFDDHLDADMDGIPNGCDEDCILGSPCDDGNPATQQDNIQADCTCLGIFPNDDCEAEGAFPWHDWIGRVVFQEIDNPSSRKKYSDFTDLTANVQAGASYPIELTANFSFAGHDAYWRVWIDYNQDNIFQEPSEIAFSGTSTAPPPESPGLSVNGNIDIPAWAVNGAARMRIAKKRSAYPGPCESFPFGEVEDYTVNIGGNTQPTLTIACPANIYQQVATGQNSASINWPEVTANSTCPDATIQLLQTEGSPNGSSFSLGMSTLSYEASDNCGNVATCSFTIVLEAENTEPGAYCMVEGEQPWSQWIANVSLGAINNSTSKDQYGDYTDQSTLLEVGEISPISITPGFSWTQWDEYVRVWIDYNQDGDFLDPEEMVFEGIYAAGPDGSSPNPLSGNIAVPDNLTPGSSRMRVALQQGAFANPCENFLLGEVEDYTVVFTDASIRLREADSSNIATQSPSTSIKVYPNPADQQLLIDWIDLQDQMAQISIHNQLGQRMNQVEYNILSGTPLSLDLSPYHAGIYYLSIQLDGKQRFYQMFIIAR
ncbi:MAG: GEVED domain-containing protein, partial [Bacteroidota bacterium]